MHRLWNYHSTWKRRLGRRLIRFCDAFLEGLLLFVTVVWHYQTSKSRIPSIHTKNIIKIMQVKLAAWFATWEAGNMFSVCFIFEMSALPKNADFPYRQACGWIWKNLCTFPVSHLADTDALSAALGHRSSTPAARAVPGTLERLPQCNICGLEDFCLTWQARIHCTCITCVISWWSLQIWILNALARLGFTFNSNTPRNPTFHVNLKQKFLFFLGGPCIHVTTPSWRFKIDANR